MGLVLVAGLQTFCVQKKLKCQVLAFALAPLQDMCLVRIFLLRDEEDIASDQQTPYFRDA